MGLFGNNTWYDADPEGSVPRSGGCARGAQPKSSSRRKAIRDGGFYSQRGSFVFKTITTQRETKNWPLECLPSRRKTSNGEVLPFFKRVWRP